MTYFAFKVFIVSFQLQSQLLALLTVPNLSFKIATLPKLQNNITAIKGCPTANNFAPPVHFFLQIIPSIG
jgi:hypothetical protein